MTFKRFWEIDLLRGLAIIMMIIFHILFDLNYFNIYEINLYSGYLLIFNYSIGLIFLLLVGISLSLSYSRVEKKLTEKELIIKYLKRGLWIFSLGLIITAFTLFFVGEGFIVFGVLHCIGLSIIFAYPFLKFKELNLILGSVLITTGLILKGLAFDFYWLIWLGLKTPGFYTLDYFPILPWFGVVLIGIFIGKNLYPDYKRIIKIKEFEKLTTIKLLCYLGRKSLVIYFLHQIVLFSIFYLLQQLYFL